MSSLATYEQVPTVEIQQLSKRDAKPERPPQPESKKAAPQRRKNQQPKDKSAALERYFLVHRKVDGAEKTITAGRELKSESEAIVEAFLAQTTFYVVTEYRVHADVNAATPQLIKEGISKTEKI